MKALRFLGVAILACSMLFVSCKKDKQYTITVNSNNTAWGTVTGGGTYAENATATLTATAKEGYKFVQWNDGNTSNPRTITVTADATYTATFAENAGPGPTPTDGTTISFNGGSWQAAGMDAVDFSSDGYNTYYIWKEYQNEGNVYLMGWMLTTPGQYTYETSDGDYFKIYDPSYIYQGMYYGYTANAETYVENITSIDLNTRKISATFSEEIGDLNLMTLDDEGYVLDWGETKTLTGTMQNATWTWQQPSAKAATKKSAKINHFVTVK